MHTHTGSLGNIMGVIARKVYFPIPYTSLILNTHLSLPIYWLQLLC